MENINSLDDNTFGDSKAAIVLAKYLSLPENKKHIRFVSRHWNRYTEIFNEIWYCKISIGHKTFLSGLLADHNLKIIEGSNLPDKVKSYLSNIICERRAIWNKVATKITLERKTRDIKVIQDRKSASK